MNVDEIKRILEAEVPRIVQESPAFKDWLYNFVRRQTVSPESFDARFDRILNELAADRETQRRHWDEQAEQWREQARRWDENDHKWEEQNRKWDEQNRKWDEENRKWEEENRRWDEQNRKWDENMAELKAMNRRHDQSIGALGARWGIASEEAFRAGLRGILEDSFGVQVLNVTEFDDEGSVFGRPDQVELDIIVKNGTLILCELKSSVSKPDMVIFERKVRFYEQRHQRTADRKIVISPMVDARAQAEADALGIEVFSYSDSVTGLK